jgi:ABC-type transport system involved in multi-copper enzyme maturation permease subunit
MVTLLEHLLGPLAAVECRRSLDRGWVLVVRALAAVPPAVVLLAILWFWWFTRQFIPDYSPGPSLAWGAAVVEGILVTAALLLGQALLAGTLAGDKARGTLDLLLTTRVSPLEIVLGRLAARLCIVGVVLAAGLPPLAWFVALSGLSVRSLAILVALPAAVAFGGGGLAIAVSAVARRARDALLMVYLVELVFLLVPLFSSPLSANLRQWIEPLNPYRGLGPLTDLEDPGAALVTIALWTALGVAGCAWAAWRLRPAYLSGSDGRGRRWHRFRAARIPLLGDRPMTWKELYVEPGQAFSRVVKWLAVLVVALFSGTSLFLAGLVVSGSWFQPGTSAWAGRQLTDWLEVSWLMAWMIQWAVGLHAAAAVTSERQRGTWDLLLASPLEGREMVLAKIHGSIHSLRGCIAAVVLAWAAGLLSGALPPEDFAKLLAGTLLIGGFMATIGMGFSLFCKSSARAMTLTIVAWLGAGCAFAALAGILSLMVMLGCVIWTTLGGNLTPGAAAGFGFWQRILYESLRLSLYGLATLLLGRYILRRVDVLIGRSGK